MNKDKEIELEVEDTSEDIDFSALYEEGYKHPLLDPFESII